MNYIKEMANKVGVLEKRLDNESNKNGLIIKEIKQSELSNSLVEPFSFSLLSLSGNSGGVVLNGNAKFSSVLGGEYIKIKILVDGYIAYEREVALNENENSVDLLTAISEVYGKSQEVVLVVERTDEGDSVVTLDGFDIFVFGYNLESNELVVNECKLSVASIEESFSVFMVENGRAYSFFGSEMPSAISFGDFNFFGEANMVVADYFFDTTNEPTLSELLIFEIDHNGDLYMQIKDKTDSKVKVDEGVDNVSCASNSSKSEVVVVYSKGCDLYYFSYTTLGLSEPILLKTMQEEIGDISMVKNFGSTAFLVVSLKSGKNYLFSSVTEVSSSSSSATLTLKMSVVF